MSRISVASRRESRDAPGGPVAGCPASVKAGLTPTLGIASIAAADDVLQRCLVSKSVNSSRAPDDDPTLNDRGSPQ
jgi:hypothetical protein